MSTKTSRMARIRRHARVRSKLEGTTERPRLSVFRSLNHIYAQVIDDSKKQTMVSASTIEAEIKNSIDGKDKKSQAEAVGQSIAKKALEKGIRKVVFDRGGYKYIGRVQALADAARKEGLKF